MLSPQQISRQLLDRTISAQEALDHRNRIKDADKHQFLDDIIFVSGLLSPIEPKVDDAATRYSRGIDVLVELLDIAPSPVRTKMVNNLHWALFSDVRSGALASDNMPAGQKLAMQQVYLALQARSAKAALHFLSRGMDRGRNDRIFSYLDACIDKQSIVAAAVQVKRVEVLYHRARWAECLPHLDSKNRDAHFAGDLGL